MKSEKLCVVTTPYWHFSLEYAMNSIASSGFHNIEFWAASPHYCYADYSGEERGARKREILALMERYGLKMPVFYPEQMNKYPLNIASADPFIRQFSLERVLEYVEDAVEFGAGAMMLGTGWQHLDAPKEENYQRAVESIRLVSDKAKQAGIRLFIEPAARTLGSFAWDLPSLKKLLEDVDRENVMACMDLAAVLDAGDSVIDWYTALEGKVGHIHFADKGGRVPGTNDGDVASALRALENLGYDGLLSLNITFRDCCLVPDRVVFATGKWLKHQELLTR